MNKTANVKKNGNFQNRNVTNRLILSPNMVFAICWSIATIRLRSHWLRFFRSNTSSISNSMMCNGMLSSSPWTWKQCHNKISNSFYYENNAIIKWVANFLVCVKFKKAKLTWWKLKEQNVSREMPWQRFSWKQLIECVAPVIKLSLFHQKLKL